jgi:hypothetical protein
MPSGLPAMSGERRSVRTSNTICPLNTGCKRFSGAKGHSKSFMCSLRPASKSSGNIAEKGVTVQRTCAMKILKQTVHRGDFWLSGLVALSLVSGGWLLGYGLAPWIRDSTTSPRVTGNSGKYSIAVPAFRQDWTALNAKRMNRNDGFER